jgi:radical SAM protein with 4Fe4S-binding SPASM domain
MYFGINRMYNFIKRMEISRRNLNGAFFKYHFKIIKSYVPLIIKWNYRKIGFSRIEIEAYGFCNRQCDYCFNNDRFPQRERGIMSKETFHKILTDLEKLKYCGMLTPTFYGEPLLDQRLPELIEFSKKILPNCFIQIFTNGDMLQEKLFRILIEKGVNHFEITNHDNCEKLELTLLKNKYPIYINLMNWNDVCKIDRAGKIFQRGAALDTPCLRPSKYMIINWKGDVLLCCQDFYGEYVMGNVNDDSLLTIWNNDKFKEYREKLAKGQRMEIPICKNCDA